jgi:hypothetical protein
MLCDRCGRIGPGQWVVLTAGLGRRDAAVWQSVKWTVTATGLRLDAYVCTRCRADLWRLAIREDEACS